MIDLRNVGRLKKRILDTHNKYTKNLMKFNQGIPDFSFKMAEFSRRDSGTNKFSSKEYGF